jgi:hypothetical protein
LIRRFVADKEGHWIPLDREPEARLHVQGDLEEFAIPGGKTRIRGKKQWREYLKRTGNIEMGHSDIAKSKEAWDQRKADFAGKIKNAPAPVDAPVLESRDYERSRLNKEIRNRLDGRPAPDRITLLKLVYEESRRHR